MIQIIDHASLDRFRTALERVTPDRARALRPGRPVTDVQRALGGAGVPVHPDLLAWFTWSDWDVASILPGMYACSMSAAHAAIELRVSIANAGGRDVPSVPMDTVWNQGWYPVLDLRHVGGLMIVDVSGSGHRPAPLRVSFPDSMWDDDSPYVAWRSLGEFVRDATAWLGATECRVEQSREGDFWTPRDYQDGFTRQPFVHLD